MAMMDIPAEHLYKLGSALIQGRAIEAAVAFLCFNFAVVFVNTAASLDAVHAVLYWFCALMAGCTGLVGLSVLGVYLLRPRSEPVVAKPVDPASE